MTASLIRSRMERIRELARIQSLNDDAKIALAELQAMMGAIRFVRNSVVHSIVIDDLKEGHVFHLRSKQRNLTIDEILSCEEITNYAAHAAISLRYALGIKGEPGERHPLPSRPPVPAFLQSKIQFP
jgi:hypothetical protein